MALLLRNHWHGQTEIATGYVVAALAPGKPMKHVIILGVIGIVISGVAAIPSWEMAPAWFLIGLIILAFPCTWLGGSLKVGQFVRLHEK